MHLSQLQAELDRLEREGLLRRPDDEPVRRTLASEFGPAFLDLSSNDYLGLRSGREPGAERSSIADLGPGSAAVEATVSRETGLEWLGQPPDRPAAVDGGRVHGGSREVPLPLRRARETAAVLDSQSESSSASSFRAPRARRPGQEEAELPAQVGGLEPPPRDVSRETANPIPRIPAGAGASRLIFGTDPTHRAVESLVAAWLGFPSALLFSTGYAANVGALGCLISPEDAVISDALNHASLIDGIRLSRAHPTVVPHLDLEAMETALASSQAAPARWVVVESYYSMDGDGPDLRAVEALCQRYGAHLYLDESHAVGVFGPKGAGLAAAAGIRPDVLMAAFGKAVGSQGACIAGSEPLRVLLWNRARSFVFSTAPSPLLCASLLDQVGRTRSADAERQALDEAGRSFRALLHQEGLPLTTGSFGPICALLVGGAKTATDLAVQLRSHGLLSQAIRPPTVPPGQSRLRITLRANLTLNDLERAVATLKSCWDALADSASS